LLTQARFDSACQQLPYILQSQCLLDSYIIIHGAVGVGVDMHSATVTEIHS